MHTQDSLSPHFLEPKLRTLSRDTRSYSSPYPLSDAVLCFSKALRPYFHHTFLEIAEKMASISGPKSKVPLDVEEKRLAAICVGPPPPLPCCAPSLIWPIEHNANFRANTAVILKLNLVCNLRKMLSHLEILCK